MSRDGLTAEDLLTAMTGLREQMRTVAALGRGNLRVRNAAVVQAREAGWTLDDIGRVLGISRERVRQILRAEGWWRQ